MHTIRLMEKKLLLPFESPRDQYRADATVVWCYDSRFTLALQVLAEKMGWKNFDLIKLDGGVRDLGSLGNEAERSYVLNQISKSLRSHKAPEIFIMAHYNCGGLGREQMDPTDDEDMFLGQELKQGKEAVERYLVSAGLSAKVRPLLCDFKNIYEVDF